MLSLNEYEVKLFTKYYGRNDLVTDNEFWQDIYEYYSKEHDALLPLPFNPYTVRMVLEMLECPPGACGKCCHYNNTQLSVNDCRRIVNNTHYTAEDLDHIVVIKEGKMSLDCTNGCPFLKKNRCTIYKARPDCCYMFPLSGKAAMAGNVKQMQIRIICEPALAVAKKIITEAVKKGTSILLPDLTIIPFDKEAK